MDSHFFLDPGTENVIAVTLTAILVDPEFWNDKDGDPLCASGSTLDPGKHRMDDILGQIMITGGDEQLVAGKGIRAIRIFDSRGFKKTQV